MHLLSWTLKHYLKYLSEGGIGILVDNEDDWSLEPGTSLVAVRDDRLGSCGIFVFHLRRKRVITETRATYLFVLEEIVHSSHVDINETKRMFSCSAVLVFIAFPFQIVVK